MQRMLRLYTVYYSWSLLPNDGCDDAVWRNDQPVCFSTSLLRSSKLVLCGKGSSSLIPLSKRAGPAPAQAAQEGLPDKAP